MSVQIESNSQNTFWTVFVLGLLLSGMAASTYFLVVAINSDRGVVTKSPYEDSLSYQKKLDVLTNTQSSTGKLTAVHSSRAFSFQIGESSEAPLTGLELSYKAMYPANSKLDQEGKCIEKDGIFSLDKPLPAEGVWLFQVSGTRDGKELLWEQQIFIQKD